VRPLEPRDLVDLERYEALRPDYREAVIAHKRRRRVALGEKVTLVFEDRETLRFQVLEMLRVERIRDPAAVQKELDVYNELMPAAGELSATLFIEITELAGIRPELDRLIGIDEHVALVLGEEAGEEVIRARFDPKQMEEERISAVQYIRFPLSPAQTRRFADPDVPARLRCDHPNYPREVELAPEVRRSLRADLEGGPEPLLDPGLAAAPDEPVLFTRGRVRARRAGGPPGAEHVIVEPVEPVGLLEAEPSLRAEVLEAVLEVAREIAGRHGGCRIHTDVGPPAERMRWHVRATPR
jgi:hypothetical protein